MSSDSDSTTTSSSDSEVQKKPVPVTKKDTSSSSDSESDVKPAPVAKKESSSSDSSDSESDAKAEAPAKKESSSSDSSDSESDKKPAKKEESSDSDSSDSESDKKPAKKEESSDSDSDSSDSEAAKKAAKKVAKKAAKKAATESDSDSESEEKPKKGKKAESSSEEEEEEEEREEKGGFVSGFKGWLEQRRVKKREQDNLDFSKKVIQSWEYNRSGALAKKVCYEGMLPHTRIVSWSVMIGKEIRIAQKLYKVNMKNGKGLQEKFEKNPDAPTEGNEKTILEIPKAIKEVFPNESSFHTANFEKDLQNLLNTWVAYRPDLGFFDGLNYVAAMCLEFQDAETAFNSTVNLINEYIITAIDSERKSEFKQYIAAFESALAEEVPDVASHFSENDVDSGVILRDWMCSLFTRCVNFEKAKRLWDILLLEGGFGLVKISCGILKFYAEKITDMKADAIYKFLKNLPEKTNMDKLAESIKSIQLAQVDFDLMMEDAKNAGADSESEEEKPAKKIEDSSEEEEEEPKKEEPKKVESSDSDSSDSDVKPVAKAAAKKVVSSSSDSSSSEDEKPAPKPAPKKVESSSSDSSSSEDEKPAPKPAPKKVESSSSDSSSSEDEKPAPKPAPKKVESSSSDSSSEDEKPAPKPAPKKVESSSSDYSSSD